MQMDDPLEKFDQRLARVEQDHAQVKMMISNHIVECGERGKRIEAKIDDLGRRVDGEPTTAWGFALQFVSKYGLGGAAMVLLGLVLWWAHAERLQLKQEQTKKLQQIERALELVPKGSP